MADDGEFMRASRFSRELPAPQTLRFAVTRVSYRWRPSMRSAIVFVLTLFAGIGCAAAQPAAAAKNSAPLSRESSIDDVLDALDQIGKELKEFSANVKLTETQNDTAMASTRSGKIWYRAGDDEPRMRVAFDTKEDDTRTYNEKV